MSRSSGPGMARPMVVLVASALLAACGTDPSSAAADPAGGATIVMIIRHAEKPDGDESGVDADGNADDSSLTSTGWERARRLVGLFEDPRAGLARPQAIYAAGANDDGEGARTRETVAPLSRALGIQVDTGFGKGEEEALAENVLARPGTTLISWQHSGIPDIARAFPEVVPQPPEEWPDDRFDVVWTLTRNATGWRFAQVPERLLPGDDDEGIAGPG